MAHGIGAEFEFEEVLDAIERSGPSRDLPHRRENSEEPSFVGGIHSICVGAPSTNVVKLSLASYG